ncbi:11535_t:CDS:2 [Acaulospora colombiana]|uniref:11535_t:CDS:1 n=1 Tax=Acaulospora colombiana TaxID=27376 RepID=A0ACA9JWD6_9GLOM|nr:11535_t:CDS:2 [Acaulospora colombiana]
MNPSRVLFAIENPNVFKEDLVDVQLAFKSLLDALKKESKAVQFPDPLRKDIPLFSVEQLRGICKSLISDNLKDKTNGPFGFTSRPRVFLIVYRLIATVLVMNELVLDKENFNNEIQKITRDFSQSEIELHPLIKDLIFNGLEKINSESNVKKILKVTRQENEEDIMLYQNSLPKSSTRVFLTSLLHITKIMMSRIHFTLFLVLVLTSLTFSFPLTTDASDFPLDEFYNEISPVFHEDSSVGGTSVTSPTREDTSNMTAPASKEALNGTASALDNILNGTLPITNGTLKSTGPATNGTLKRTEDATNGASNNTVPAVKEILNSTAPAGEPTIEFIESPETADDSEIDEDGSRLVNNPFLRYNIEQLVSTSNLFGFHEGGHKKVKVLVLPKGKAFHIIYKVLVFPKDKKGIPKLYKLIVIPGKTKDNQKEVKLILIPKDNPGAWREYNVVIPYKH